MDLEQKMNETLRSLRLNTWTAVLTPKDGQLHGEALIEEKLIVIFDEDPKKVWDTFIHEVLEIKFREVVRPHRLLCNALIEVIDKLSYAEKEKFLDELPRTLEILNAEAPGGN